MQVMCEVIHTTELRRSRALFARCIIRTLFLTLCSSGCMGVFTYLPAECRNEIPTLDARDLEWSELKYAIVTKAEYITAWGKPDTINNVSEGVEEWIYKRRLWCGVMPVFFIPLPLLLPVCEGYERLEFQKEKAKRLQIRRIVVKSYMVAAPGSIAKMDWRDDPVCRYPMPDK